MKAYLPVILSKVASRKDRSYKLEFETRELGEEAAMLFRMVNDEGFLLFSPNDDITEVDVPKERADAGLGTKTPSQRQRAIIYLLWEQNGKVGDFESYYRTKMEYINDILKEKLDN